MENIPAELITEILQRLPVKPLLCLRCVSKSFCKVIDSQNFIKEHLSRSIETRTHRKIILHEQRHRIPGHYYPEDIFAVDFDGDGIQERKKLNHPFKPKHRTWIYGSCNGLLLLQIDHNRFFLWNPFTRRCKKLPECPVDTVFGLNCISGFGYDSVSDDYKFVRIASCFKPRQVWVYSLRSNSWRRLQDDFPYTGYIYGNRTGGCFTNGALHWLLYNREPKHILIAFDIATETFCVVSQPVKISENSTVDLDVLEGCLTFSITTYGNRQERLFESYVRENDGIIGFVWTKLFTSQGRYLELMRPLAYSEKGDKVLFRGINSKEIMWVDIKNKRREIVQINSIYWAYFHATFCWESLVSLGDDSEFDGAVCREISE